MADTCASKIDDSQAAHLTRLDQWTKELIANKSGPKILWKLSVDCFTHELSYSLTPDVAMTYSNHSARPSR